MCACSQAFDMASSLKIPTPQPIDDLEGWLRAFVQPTVLVELAVLIACVGVKVLRAAFREARWARSLEHTISWVAWLVMVLWVSGLLPVVLNELDQITWKVGSGTLSVRNLIEGLLTASGVLIIGEQCHPRIVDVCRLDAGPVGGWH